MNQFGGSWTEAKMKIVVDYAKAYLVIMNKQAWAKTLYFDGFAGSGLIDVNQNEETVKGTALRILDVQQPKPFDMYYFVEKDEKYKLSLQSKIEAEYFGRNAHVVQADCNLKLMDMANYLKKHSNYTALAFIDPYGMTVNWSSIKALQGLHIDLWILVPTGVGVNRLLKNDKDIPEAWLIKLEQFLGLPRDEILTYFYSEKTINTLFGDETSVNKEKSTIQKVGNLYAQRLKTVFKYVSDSFVMRNSNNSIMYHFMMATNNTAALNIANDVIKPNYKI